MKYRRIYRRLSFFTVTLACLLVAGLLLPHESRGFDPTAADVAVSGQLSLGDPYAEPPEVVSVDIDDTETIGGDYRESIGSETLSGMSGSGIARVDTTGFSVYTTMDIPAGDDYFGGVSADAGYMMGLYLFDGSSNDDTTLTFYYDLHGSLSIDDADESGLAGVNVFLYSYQHVGGGSFPVKDSDLYGDNLMGHEGMSSKTIDIYGAELEVDVPLNEWFLLKSYLVSTAQLDPGGPLSSDQTVTSDFYSTLVPNSLQADGLTIYSTDVDLFGIPDLQPGTWGENPVPIPSAIWLLGSGLIGLIGIRRMFNKG